VEDGSVWVVQEYWIRKWSNDDHDWIPFRPLDEPFQINW